MKNENNNDNDNNKNNKLMPTQIHSFSLFLFFFVIIFIIITKKMNNEDIYLLYSVVRIVRIVWIRICINNKSEIEILLF